MHKAVACFGGVIVVDSSSAGVPAVNAVTGGLKGGGIWCYAPVAVIDTGKSSLLIDYACHRVGKG